MATKPERYEFDGAFQTKIAALTLRDDVFNARVEGLVQPGYFMDEAEAALVGLTLDYYGKFKKRPDTVTLIQLLKDAVEKKRVRDDLKDDIKDKIKELLRADISDREYVADTVAEFARHQAIFSAIESSVGLLDKRDFDSIGKLIKSAVEIGVNNEGTYYDYFEQIETRTMERKEFLIGKKDRDGITTGIAELDKLLYRGGWGRRELTTLMAGAKKGKSIGLSFFAMNAVLAGHNVLFVTLEVATDIVAARMDARLSQVEMGELAKKHNTVADKVKEAAGGKRGTLKIHEYPTGTFRPADLRRLLEKYRAQGITFDLIVLDYADIMAPDTRYRDNQIAESKSIYEAIRAIGQEEGAAILTATQTNRGGHKAHTATAADVAEDFNRIRIADLVISINADEYERADKQARLHFAASRNQAGDFTVTIGQDLERMLFVTKVIGAS